MRFQCGSTVAVRCCDPSRRLPPFGGSSARTDIQQTLRLARPSLPINSWPSATSARRRIAHPLPTRHFRGDVEAFGGTQKSLPHRLHAKIAMVPGRT